MAYDAGTAFLSVVPSFRGVQSLIDREAQRWGGSAGRQFSDSFNREVSTRTRNAPVGPSEQQSRRQGQDNGGAFAAGFRRRVEAALRNLPEPTVGVATSQAEQDIRDLHDALRRLSGQRIGVDIDEAEALAEIDRIQRELTRLGAESTSVQVRTDTGRAAAELEAIRREVEALDRRDADVDVNVDDHGSLGRGVVGMRALTAAALSLGPALIPIGAVALAGIGAIGPAAIAGGIGLGVMALGFAGVSDAVKALSEQQKNAAKDAQAAGEAQANAARQVESAQESLQNARASAAEAGVRASQAIADAQRAEQEAVEVAAEANERAAERVADSRRAAADAARSAAQQVQQALEQQRRAEQSLADAQVAAKDAQEALTDARKAAREQMQDLGFRVEQGAIRERQAVLDVAEAQESLNKTLADPKATQAAKDEAQIRYDQAALGMRQLRVENARLAEEKAAADAAGIRGSEQVQSALERVRDTRRGESEAQRELGKAEENVTATRKESARQVADAQRAIADAVKAQVRTQADGADRIAAAQDAIGDAVAAQASQQRQSAFAVSSAQRQVTAALAAQAKAADTSSSSSEKVAESMAALSPAGRRFARFIFGLRDEVKRLKTAAAGGLLPGVQAGIEAMLPSLPKIVRLFRNVSAALGDLFEGMGRGIAGPTGQRFLDFFVKFSGPAIRGMGKVLGDLTKGFIGLSIAFAPVAEDVGRWLSRLTTSFANFGANAGGNSGFRGFMEYVRESAPLVRDTFRSIGGAVANLVKALAPIGLVVLAALGKFADAIRALPTGVLTVLLATVISITAAIIAANAVLRGIEAATKAWTLATKIATIATRAWAVAMRILNAVMRMNPIGLIVTGLVLLGTAFVLAYQNSETFRKIVDASLRGVAAAGKWMWEKVLKPIFDGLVWYFQNVMAPVYTWLWQKVAKPAFEGIGSAARVMWERVLRPLFKTLLDGFTTLATGIINTGAKILDALGMDGLADKLREASRDMEKFRDESNRLLGGIKDRTVNIKANLDANAKALVKQGANPQLAAAIAAGMGVGVGVRTNQGRATGGPIPGSPSSVDNLIAPVISRGKFALQPLAGGEHVVSAREVQAAGGHRAVEAWRRSLLPGRSSGGPIIDIRPTVPSTDDFRIISSAMNVSSRALARGMRASVKVIENAVNKAAESMGTLTGGDFRASQNGWPPPQLGVVSPNTAAAAAYVRERWGVYSGLLGSRPNKSDHPYGKALDAMTSNLTKGNGIASFFTQNPDRFGTKYVIWQQQINSGSGWRKMEDRGSPTANHMDHVHVSLYDKGGYLPPGMSVVMNGTGKPEPVLTAPELSLLRANAVNGRSRGYDGPPIVIEQMQAVDIESGMRKATQRQRDLNAVYGR